ncbi:MAG TPA: galactokinase [Pirellulaceae bacterium]|nr:galactokinase [Pirellulaceae bacterium]HMO92690.1 galactokinase [Pirellulaceae bacterium]HMP70389.1 galactokinase [Pirellulaceae bacterium]
MTPTENNLLIEGLVADFRAEYSTSPQIVAIAPGRVNLIGEHVDYNQGVAIPFAVQRYVIVAARIRNDAMLRVKSVPLGESKRLNLDEVEGRIAGSSGGLEPRWLAYVAGAIIETTREMPICGMDLVIDANLPIGAGLSSSAALTSAIVTALDCLLRLNMDLMQKAVLCQRVEQRYLGVPCGMMDPWACMASELGCLLKLDFLTHTHEQIPWDSTNPAFLIVNSGIKHDLADGAYALRREECRIGARLLNVDSLRFITGTEFGSHQNNLPIQIAKRIQHVCGEIARVEQAAELIRGRDWNELGKLLVASHHSLSELYEVSCPEVDDLVKIVVGKPGVFGARMTGGGFGGAVIALVDSNLVPKISQSVAEEFNRRTGLTPQIFETKPQAGVRIISV